MCTARTELRHNGLARYQGVLTGGPFDDNAVCLRLILSYASEAMSRLWETRALVSRGVEQELLFLCLSLSYTNQIPIWSEFGTLIAIFI